MTGGIIGASTVLSFLYDSRDDSKFNAQILLEDLDDDEVNLQGRTHTSPARRIQNGGKKTIYGTIQGFKNFELL